MTTKIDKEPETSLGLKSKFRFEVVILLVSWAFGFGLLYAKLDYMDSKLESYHKEQWNKSHQLLWAVRLSNKNPTVIVPEVRDVIVDSDK